MAGRVGRGEGRSVGRYAAAVRVEAPSVTTRDRREHYPPIGLDPCIVNGRLRHTGQGASRHAPPCVVSRVGFSVLQTSSTGARHRSDSDILLSVISSINIYVYSMIYWLASVHGRTHQPEGRSREDNARVRYCRRRRASEAHHRAGGPRPTGVGLGVGESPRH